MWCDSQPPPLRRLRYWEGSGRISFPRRHSRLQIALSVGSLEVGALLGRLHHPEVGVQTRSVRQVEPSPRFFRPAGGCVASSRETRASAGHSVVTHLVSSRL